MRTAVVPAQVTTVEDRIAANLTFTQLLLLVAPVFIAAVLFAAAHPMFELAAYKLVLGALISIVCLSLAIRIKGVLVLHWLVLVLRYRIRPQYYVFKKNSLVHRDITRVIKDVDRALAIEDTPNLMQYELLSVADSVRANSIMSDPSRKVSIRKNKKGGLRVIVQEISQERV